MALEHLSAARPAIGRRSLSLSLLALCAGLIVGCGQAGESAPKAASDRSAPSPASPAPAPEPALSVVASFTILADMVSNVGGDRVSVVSLVGPDSDAHRFSPTPGDAKAIAAAQLVFVNGLGFEGWLDKLIAASGFKGPVVVASEGIETIRMAAHGHSHGHHHHHGDVDPHDWQSLANARRYVQNIADALAKADPAHEAGYRARAAAYIEAIDALDAQARQRIEAIPAAERRMVTGHDAFGYLGRAYGITILSPRGVSTESEASARDVAALIRQIRNQRIRAVFVENISDPRLIEQLARESGARVGGVLFSDALSVKDPRGRTYLDMMRHNLDEIAGALAPAAS